MRVNHDYHLWVLQCIVSDSIKVVSHDRRSHNVKLVVFERGKCLSVLQGLVDQLISLSHDLDDSELVISVDVSNEDNSQLPDGFVYFLIRHEMIQKLPIWALCAIHQYTVTTNEHHDSRGWSVLSWLHWHSSQKHDWRFPGINIGHILRVHNLSIVELRVICLFNIHHALDQIFHLFSYLKLSLIHQIHMADWLRVIKTLCSINWVQVIGEADSWIYVLNVLKPFGKVFCRIFLVVVDRNWAHWDERWTYKLVPLWKLLGLISRNHLFIAFMTIDDVFGIGPKTVHEVTIFGV